MKILVTGATGFLGSHLVRRLCGSHHLVCLSRDPQSAAWPPGVETVAADLRDSGFVAHLPDRLDAVVHLAVVPPSSSASPLEMAQVNALSTVLLLEHAARSGGRRFLYGSTGSVYGAGPGPFSEDTSPRPADVFSASKLSGELMVGAYGGLLSTAALRFFYLYGPGQPDFLLVPRLFRRIERGEPVTIHRGGGPALSFTYIDDAVEAVVRALESDEDLTLNVAHPRPHTILALAEGLGRLAGRRPEFVTDDKEAQDVTADVGRLEEALGLRARTDLDEGLSLTFGGKDRDRRGRAWANGRQVA